MNNRFQFMIFLWSFVYPVRELGADRRCYRSTAPLASMPGTPPWSSACGPTPSSPPSAAATAATTSSRSSPPTRPAGRAGALPRAPCQVRRGDEHLRARHHLAGPPALPRPRLVRQRRPGAAGQPTLRAVVSHNDSLNRRDLEPDYSVSDWVGNRFNLARGTVS